MVLFAALLLAAPFHAALAQDLGSAESFAVLGGTAVTLTNSAVIGDVGSPVAVTVTTSTVDGTVYPAGDPIVVAAYEDFLFAYDALANDYLCTGSLDTAYTDATVTLEPGVYCNIADVTFTRTTLTLDAQGDPDAVWIFKIGTNGTGALTGTGFSVVMANGGDACNVYWWIAEAVTMTDSNLKGNILAGAAATFTRGTLKGRVLAQAGVTMTGTDVTGCSSLAPPPIDKDFCEHFCEHFCKYYWKDFCKHHDRDKKHCNQGIGNGPEDCDPGNSNQGYKSRSNDEWGGKPGSPGRKGGNR